MRVFKKLAAYLVLLALIALPLLIYLNAQALSDWWALHGYTAPAAVDKLAAQDTMTSYARRIFLVNHPDIESDANQFRSDCNETEKTIILGCYHSDQRGIFLFDVRDPRLAGVEQVTAAHEMLHAAYDRLSSKDRSNIDGLLQDYYSHQLHDKRIIETINAYKQSEPNDVVNEMHSIFGTEISSLPSPLEKYYQRYFTDRQAVTSFESDYQGEFTDRENLISADDAKLSRMKTSIDAQEQSLEQQLNQIDSDKARLDSLRTSRQYQQYNAAVPGFNAEVNAYNDGIVRLRADITAYNQLVGARNDIARELASLSKSIDTRLTTQSTK